MNVHFASNLWEPRWFYTQTGRGKVHVSRSCEMQIPQKVITTVSSWSCFKETKGFWLNILTKPERWLLIWIFTLFFRLEAKETSWASEGKWFVSLWSLCSLLFCCKTFRHKCIKQLSHLHFLSQTIMFVHEPSRKPKMTFEKYQILTLKPKDNVKKAYFPDNIHLFWSVGRNNILILL